MFDVSPLLPEARPVALKVAEVYTKCIPIGLIGILIHGSALKGGLIPYGSDIDFKLFVEDAILDEHGQLHLPTAMNVQRELAKLDIAPFAYVQTYIKSPNKTTKRSQEVLVPGSYHMLLGEMPFPEATREDVRQSAQKTLETFANTAWLAEDLLTSGSGRLDLAVRWLCTQVWPVMKSVLTLQADDPFEIWQMSKVSAMGLLPLHSPMGISIHRFYQSVVEYYGQKHDVERALRVIEHGSDFIHLAAQWHQNPA